MGRGGPAATYKTRAEKNEAQRLRYQQRNRGPLPSQESSVPGSPRTRKRVITCQFDSARALSSLSIVELEQVVRDPHEPRREAGASPHSGPAPDRAAAPDTLDAGSIPEPQITLEGSLPLSADNDFSLDDLSLFDSGAEMLRSRR